MAAMRYTITFRGRVQGVGFRATTISIARGFQITGWVRNEPDGSVRCVAEGEPAEVERFIAAVKGEMAGYVRETQIEKGEATGEFGDFGVRY